MSRELTTYNTKLFAERVMPQLTGLFENEWEHKWWPKPLQKSAKSMPRAVAAA
jgi:hypothetical protein